ncbi:MAG TPA: hypothetical protein PKL38_07220, partial [Smithella sp.]|nr:hypothetical protein [Smithella sp.]
LVHAAAEQIAPVTFQVVVVFVILPKIRFGQSNLFFMLFFYILCRKKLVMNRKYHQWRHTGEGRYPELNENTGYRFATA